MFPNFIIFYYSWSKFKRFEIKKPLKVAVLCDRGSISRCIIHRHLPVIEKVTEVIGKYLSYFGKLTRGTERYQEIPFLF